MKTYLKVTEVAELLGVQNSAIYHWTHIGFIPHFKWGNILRFEVQMILAWFDKVGNKGRKPRGEIHSNSTSSVE